ncbi:MAG TPA: 1,4-dihydroxy-2-naphthoate polyprenyltransferase, partial [Ilumatobacteraceae bacterium]
MNRWILGARPRTLPAAVVPVAIGAGAAVGGPSPVWWRVIPAMIVSLALQIGVNYANDYSDGVRGTDDVRVGPVRLVAGRLATASAVKRAALIAFGVAGVAGLVLAIATSWWLIVVGLLAMLAAWGYTGGPKPYGYLGLGEVFVFVFFGLVATLGTTYAVIERWPARSWVAGAVAGFLACALLVVNNLRDIPTDSLAGK